ncbi:DUF6228 family protein [Streptomyces sp. DT2A-34]|uniref:DUF6228 family protein n=1 Tax=Streptomyces sp. DT2A-34 TaxID=3051182 RepID=UPI00265BFE1A|nr:DUF6228 family protein [Streptomyces sp. DT2A-34]MDO0913810.1 DUF6228 family protein [Streptomyces sp. DT2A-34]
MSHSRRATVQIHWAARLRRCPIESDKDQIKGTLAIQILWERTGGVVLAGRLSLDCRGWDGERSRQTNDRDLAVSAVFRSGGHVGPTCTLRPWPNAAGGWNASVTTWLEAGEQMSTFAADIRRLLASSLPRFLASSPRVSGRDRRPSDHPDVGWNAARPHPVRIPWAGRMKAVCSISGAASGC